MRGKKLIFISLLALVTPVAIILTVWFVRTDIRIREKFAEKSFLMPTQFYSNTLELQTNQILQEKVLVDLLNRNNYRQKSWGTVLQPSDYAFTTGEECSKIHSSSLKCFAFHHHQHKKINIIGADETDRIMVILEVDSETQESKSLDRVLMFPQLFAQYVGTSPVIQEHLPLGQIPRYCLDAALAVEDPDFLEHQGVSPRGLLRSQLSNLMNLRITSSGLTIVRPQGGSTITQQLVKVNFLSSERKISRKIKEMFMALLLELRIPKDQILETYLNVIYLGQQGNFQVRGYGAAAQFYFSKRVEDLNLGECALLGAIVNSPGLFNPFRHPERALQRREKVLNAMLEQNRILKENHDIAMAQPLPKKVSVEIKETAPYFIDGVVKELRGMGYNDLSGMKIYTTLDLIAQSHAQKAVQTHLANLEATSEYHKQNKSHSLQAILVSADPKNGEILALVGGRDHRLTPYNRVLESKRQVGSIFKPLVFLTAFHELESFGPATLLDNSAFMHKYGRQTWQPRNYDGKYSDPVPAFYALKESLNVPTARLALDVGLDEIIDVAEKLGVTSTLKAFPALSLGAFELTPREVLQMYVTMARFGSRINLKLIKRIENMEGDAIYTPPLEQPEQILDPGYFAMVDSILQEAMLSGTGQSARARGLMIETAGKTGTTSDYRDAWFAGFSANHVAVVWTGYDDNTPIKLSGASGALPIWTDYMLSMSNILPGEPFNWPQEKVETIELSAQELLQAGLPENKAVPTKILVYKK